jgi:murein DD-endopeptidase MepM/ murein hydrolase activator NlpD
MVALPYGRAAATTSPRPPTTDHRPLFVAIVLLLISPGIAAQAKLSVESDPPLLTAGAPCVFRVKSSVPLQSLRGTWLEREVFFDYDRESGKWYALGGTGLETSTGSHNLALEGLTLTGVKTSLREDLTVERATHITIALRVARKYTEPDARTLERVHTEQALKQQIFAHKSPLRLWSGSFVVPIVSIVTEPFGTERTFNGTVQSVHQGLDYRAERGTPISAMNSGTILLARDLFFEGNTVVIDHGQGLLTLYLHLSEIGVKEGDQVERGQVVGKTGATGRVTAPHLHVAVRWQGIYLDPARVLKLSLPLGGTSHSEKVH